MDIALRILHIVAGVYMAGTYIFFTLIMLPQLHAMGTAIEHPVIRKILRPAAPASISSGFIILGTGIAMGLRLRGGNIDTILATGWGWAMLIALIALVAGMALGFTFLSPLGMRLERIYRGMEGREPTAKETQEVSQLIARMRSVERVNFVLILIALVAMPVSRFV
jgi:hypothetical protein